MTSRLWLSAIGLLILAGCTFPVRQQVDDMICDRSSLSRDIQPKGEKDSVLPAAQKIEPATTLEGRLTVPNSVPGARAPFIIWPDAKAPKDERDAAVKKFFPPVPKLQPDPDFPPGPDGLPLTLAELQRIAFSKSPVLKQVASDIEAARGAALQAGMYPNPSIGYQSSSFGPSGGPMFGMLWSQTIKTGGKLKLAQAAAMMDLSNAEIAYRRAETDLMSNVRSSYYAVLVAQESIRANRGLVELTDEVYRVMVDQLKGGVVAPYEPLQLKVFSEQARNSLFQARNSRLQAWRQLAATLGEPHMPATALAGNIHREVPRIDFEKALAHVLTKHTDVLSTLPTIEKARHNLLLAQAAVMPDVNVMAGVQSDVNNSGPARVVSNIQVMLPVPFFDQNRGGIRLAQAVLVRANEEPHRVRSDLTSRFSEAYRRYEENRLMLERYQKNILPTQVQAFRAAVKRHFGGAVGDVAFNDLVTSEQTLVAVIGNYLPVLLAQWQAVVDVSSLLQTDQLYLAADEINFAPPVDFEEMLKLPFHHPCAPAMPAPTRDSFRMAPATQLVSQPTAAPAPIRATFATPMPLAPTPVSYDRVDAPMNQDRGTRRDR